jgi:hypothetical protein
MKSKNNDLGLFQVDEATRIATSPSVLPSDLGAIVNRSHEVNRLLAVHPNSTAEILSQLLRYQEEKTGFDQVTRRMALRHPNISAEDAVDFGTLFPDDLFNNPEIASIVAKYPRLLSEDCDSGGDYYLLLRSVNCPLSVLERVAVEGTRDEQAVVARNPSLPQECKNRLSSEYFHKRDVSEILMVAAKQEDEVLRSCIEMYANVSRPFCVPQFLHFDRTNYHHRLEDQVFCGFPFTSKEFPWPVENLGKHMQPIAQIDLVGASNLLGVNLGDGLLQVWGGVESCKKVDLLTRLIPADSLASELDWFYPDYAPWLSKRLDFDGCTQSSIDNSDFPEFGVDSCRVVWSLAGKMFYPNVWNRVFDPRRADQVDHIFKERDRDWVAKLEEVEEELSAARISRPVSLRRAWGEDPLVVLGGYAEDLGNAWSSHRGDMLFYHSLDYGVLITIGVTYEVDDSGDLRFSVNSTCDK